MAKTPNNLLRKVLACVFSFVENGFGFQHRFGNFCVWWWQKPAYSHPHICTYSLSYTLEIVLHYVCISSKTILNDRKPYRPKYAVREDTNSCCSLSFFGGSLLRAFFRTETHTFWKHSRHKYFTFKEPKKKTLNEIKKENMVAEHTFALPMWTANHKRSLSMGERAQQFWARQLNRCIDFWLSFISGKIHIEQ